MARMKLNGKKQGHFRAWFILSVLIGGVSVVTAASTVWMMSRQANPQQRGATDPLSVAEREGAFKNIKAALRWPNLEFGIEGSALVIEGTAESDTQRRNAIELVKKWIKADSFYIVHPYIQRPDWISGRVEAMREGNFDYRHPNRSVLIVDLMKTEEAPAKPRAEHNTVEEAPSKLRARADWGEDASSKLRAGADSLEKARRILAEMPDLKRIESLRVEPIVRDPRNN